MRLWTSATTYMDVHPTFLYESLWNVIGLLLLLFCRVPRPPLRRGEHLLLLHLVWSRPFLDRGAAHRQSVSFPLDAVWSAHPRVAGVVARDGARVRRDPRLSVQGQKRPTGRICLSSVCSRQRRRKKPPLSLPRRTSSSKLYALSHRQNRRAERVFTALSPAAARHRQRCLPAGDEDAQQAPDRNRNRRECHHGRARAGDPMRRGVFGIPRAQRLFS